jgi:hypoxanthine phosphoribosyltransferase
MDSVAPTDPNDVHPSDGRKMRVLHDEAQIAARVAELGRRIREDAGSVEVTLLCILKGSFIFTADLARAISGPVRVEFLGVKSYGDGTTSSGAVQITHDLTAPIQGKYVVLVEDIIDTGLTIRYLLETLRARAPAFLRVCTLFERPLAGSAVEPDYVGFRLQGSEFIVGYGLDWAQRLRNLPYVAEIETV